MIVAKGIARMTAEEARMRNDYDKNEITHMTASIIDNTLLPLIKDVFNHVVKGVESVTLDAIRTIIPLKDEQINDFTVELKNVMGDKQIEERTAEIGHYIQVIGAIAQIAQAGVIDVKPLLKEMANLYDMAGSSTEGFIAELNQISSGVAQQAASNIAADNSTV